jgi:hypothetical protein
MQWMNSHQLEKAHTDENFRRVFAECYGLSLAMTRAVTEPGYNPPHELGDSVALTDEGQEWARVACQSIEGLTPSLAKLAVFCVLYDLDLLVDVAHTDRTTMRSVLGHEAQVGRLRYPWVFRHDLYDRYFVEFAIQTDQETTRGNATRCVPVGTGPCWTTRAAPVRDLEVPAAPERGPPLALLRPFVPGIAPCETHASAH